MSETGEEITEWVTIKNPQIKHFNLCLNNIDDDLESDINSIIDRTPEEFSLTLSSNPIVNSTEIIEKLHTKITNLHKATMEKAIAEAEEGNPEGLAVDPNIHMRRLAI